MFSEVQNAVARVLPLERLRPNAVARYAAFAA
jgi:hypothetical protein